ncbi:MAG TPA: chitobiase/beta-hexosaminidase C-terminal domain-containing protein [Solirubrobacteraceae bacterium]|nr:chitobiase/beta-hexosaminidase C-terminal domain-containing protein [Solirubrobacteraceae bacterium]
MDEARPVGSAGRSRGQGRLAAAKRLGIAGSAVIGLAAFAAPAPAAVAPGHNLEVNHSIEFGLLEGVPAGTPVTVEVLRNGIVVASKSGTSQVDPAGKLAGLFEINHVGPDASDCWDGVPAGRTPDVKPGDEVRATYGPNPGDVDSFFIRDIAFDENLDGSVTGHARGNVVGGVFDITTAINPDVEVMEAKRVGATVEADFPFTSAEVDQITGEFANVAVGGTAGEGELFIDHLDETGGGSGTTTTGRTSDVAELPCGPLATVSLSNVSHDVINAANVGTDMIVGGTAFGGDTADSLLLGGVDHSALIQTVGETWSATIPASALAALANNASHTLSVGFSDGTPTETRSILKDITAPVVSALRSGDAVTLSSDGGEVIHYTTNGTQATALSPVYAAAIPLPVGTTTINTLATDAAGNPTSSSFQFTRDAPVVVVNNPGGGAGAGPGAGAGAGTGTATGTGTTAATGTGTGTGAGAGTTTGASATKLSLKRLTMAPKIKRRTARARGIGMVMELPDGATVAKINVYRRNGSKLTLLSSTVKSLTAGRKTVRQNSASLRKLLNVGSYEVQVTPGAGKTDLGTTSKVRFKIVR